MSNEQKYEQLDIHIAQWKAKKGALMPVMHAAQGIFGCLNESVQAHISDVMGIPMSEIYGVATFYSRFTLEPKGKYIFGVCLGTACYVRGAQSVHDELVHAIGIEAGHTTSDGLFTIDALRCIGCCGLSPAMMVNDEVYGSLTAKDVQGIVDKYKNKPLTEQHYGE